MLLAGISETLETVSNCLPDWGWKILYLQEATTDKNSTGTSRCIRDNQMGTFFIEESDMLCTLVPWTLNTFQHYAKYNIFSKVDFFASTYQWVDIVSNLSDMCSNKTPTYRRSLPPQQHKQGPAWTISMWRELAKQKQSHHDGICNDRYTFLHDMAPQGSRHTY